MVTVRQRVVARLEFDKLVHQPTRLRIFAHLYPHGETGFLELVAALGVTEGNPSSHLQRMEVAQASIRAFRSTKVVVSHASARRSR